jgi:exonuclease VII small subunit
MNEETAFDLNSPLNFLVFFKRLFTEDFMPHGHCYFWRPDILWLNVLSDVGICLAYYAIPIILIYFIRKRRDVPFHWMFLMFGAFIFLCGTTHLVDVVTTWIPVYRFEGVVKLATAIVSIATAILLVPLMPRAINLPSLETVISQLSQKTDELEKSNKELERFNRITIGREERIMEFKQEVNKLSTELGRDHPYKTLD